MATITSDRMIHLGFSESFKSFKKDKIRFVKHPTMNWLSLKQGKEKIEFRNMGEIIEFLNNNNHEN